MHIEPRSLVFFPCDFKTEEMCNEVVHGEPYTLDYVPDHFKTQEMCNEAMCDNPAVFFLIPDRFKIQGMYIKAVKEDPSNLRRVPDHLKTQEICNEAVRIKTALLGYVPDRLTTKEMCSEALGVGPWRLKRGEMYNVMVVEGVSSMVCVPDWFVTQQQIKIWHDYDEYCNNDEAIEWYEGHRKRKAQKAQIKKELMPIAYHPSRWWDWCVPEDDKKREEKLWK